MATPAPDFLLTQKALPGGVVFNDLDGDGSRDEGEAGLSGWRVFLDADNDGVPDSGEKSVLSDSSGNWPFRDPGARTYRVRVVQQSGSTRTAPTGGSYGVTLSGGQAATGPAVRGAAELGRRSAEG